MKNIKEITVKDFLTGDKFKNCSITVKSAEIQERFHGSSAYKYSIVTLWLKRSNHVRSVDLNFEDGYMDTDELYRIAHNVTRYNNVIDPDKLSEGAYFRTIYKCLDRIGNEIADVLDCEYVKRGRDKTITTEEL